MHRADKNGHKIWGPAINTATGQNSYITTGSDAIWTHDGFGGGPSLITIRYSSENLTGMSHNFLMKVNGNQSLQSNRTGAIKSTPNTQYQLVELVMEVAYGQEESQKFLYSIMIWAVKI